MSSDTSTDPALVFTPGQLRDRDPRLVAAVREAREAADPATAGRDAMAWTWALTGTAPSPITLQPPPGEPPSREAMRREARAGLYETDRRHAQIGADPDGTRREQIHSAAVILNWLAGVADTLPGVADQGRLLGARPGYVRADDEIAAMLGRAERALARYGASLPTAPCGPEAPWSASAWEMDIAYLRGVRDELAAVLAGPGAHSPGYLDAATSVMLQGRPDGEAVRPGEWPAPQTGEGAADARAWLRGEHTGDPVTPDGYGVYNCAPDDLSAAMP